VLVLMVYVIFAMTLYLLPPRAQWNGDAKGNTGIKLTLTALCQCPSLSAIGTICKRTRGWTSV